MQKQIKVALVGQPNVGKSMLINSLSHARLKVGNFTGVTIQKQQITFDYKDYTIEVTDLPGSYSIADYSLEEKVTKSYLDSGDYDVILNVLDSTNLERNLYLSTELLSLNKKMIVALNMDDEAKKESIFIDEKELSKYLARTCIKTSATKKTGLNELLENIVKSFESTKKNQHFIFSKAIEDEIQCMNNFLENNTTLEGHHRTMSIQLLKEDKSCKESLKENENYQKIMDAVKQAHQNLKKHFETEEVSEIFEDEKIAFSKKIAKMVQRKRKPIDTKALTEKIDVILLNKYLGLPIFLLFMWVLFQLTFTIGQIPMNWIADLTTFLANYSKDVLGQGQVGSLVGDGVISGVGAVMSFVPNIFILFLGIALLESTGYMSRVAFLLDGFFHKFGLHGKSFIPLVTGFGCSVPAYMAARTLRNDKDRLLTLFIIGFMSCGARLPLYVLFTGAFFSASSAGNALFVIYLVGAIIGLIMAKILKLLVFKNKSEPFVMEMPKYRMPSLKLLWINVFSKVKMYFKKAGTYILVVSVVIWFASNYPKYPHMEQTYATKVAAATSQTQKIKLNNNLAYYNLEHSYLGKLGKFSEPFFAPLGYDWKMGVAIEAGLAAKEVVVSTLGVLYRLGNGLDGSEKTLIQQIKENIPFASGISFIVFIMIYIPCFAAAMVFVKESGSWMYLLYLFLFTTAMAWILSFIAYHVVLAI